MNENMKNKKNSKPYFAEIYICSIFLFIIVVTNTLVAQISNWESRGIGGGGALYYPRVNPHNTDELYIACDMGDLFHSLDQGLSWKIVDFRNLKTGRMANIQFTSNPDVLYTRDFNFDAYIWFPVKSTDGGISWNPLPNDPTGGETYYVYADNKSTERLIVTSYRNVHFSNDGGDSWTQLFSNASNDAAYIGGVFWDSTNIFIGTSRGLLISTDNGNSFSISDISGIPSSDGFIAFTGSKQGDTTRLFGITTDTSNMWPGVTGSIYEKEKDILKLDYGISSSWTSCANGIPLDKCFYFICMSENNINTVYIAGEDKSLGFPSVFKTTDGANTWEDVFLTENNQNIKTGWAGRHGDIDWWWGGIALGFTVCRSNPDIAIVTDMGFPHMTSDGGNQWRQIYVNKDDENPAGSATPKGKSYRSIGFENTSSWWITWSDSVNMFIGYADFTAIRSTDAGTSWSKNYSGLTINSVFTILKHPDNGNLYAATSSVHDIYESSRLGDNTIDDGNGGVMISTDKGATWETLHDFEQPVVWIAFDPNDYNTMYASVVHSQTGGIFVSHDIQNGNSSTWTKLINPPRTEGHPFNIKILNDGTIVCSYSARLNDKFTKSSGVFKSTDNGNSWVDCSDSGMIYWTRDIVIDSHDPQQNTWYACVYSGWGGDPNTLGGLYRTTNRGDSWTRISDLYRVGSCTNHPKDSNILFLTTESQGIWYSNNITSTNPTFTQEGKYRFGHPQRIFFNPYNQNEIWVTSFGNGTSRGLETSVDIKLSNNNYTEKKMFKFSYNPCAKIIGVRFELDISMKLDLKIYNILGQEIKVLVDNRFFKKGSYTLNLPIDIKTSGVYFLHLNGNKTSLAEKFTVLE